MIDFSCKSNPDVVNQKIIDLETNIKEYRWNIETNNVFVVQVCTRAVQVCEDESEQSETQRSIYCLYIFYLDKHFVIVDSED